MKLLWGILLAFLPVYFLSAQSLDPTVATVKLSKTAVITQKAFRDKQSAYEKATGKTFTPEDKTALLDAMIQEELFAQAAEKQGIKVTEEDILKTLQSNYPNMSIENIKAGYEQQNNMSWDKVLVVLKRKAATERYIISHPKAEAFQRIDVSDKEVTDYYDNNKAQFVCPDMVRFSHIYFDTKVNPKGTLTEIKARAEDAQSKISSGKATFEEMVRKVSEDKRSAALNGDLGFIPRNLDSAGGKQLIQLFGKDFLDAIFALKNGQVSAVLVSNSGFHIVKATDKIDQHFMSLDEEIYPGKTGKVRDWIKQSIQQSKAAETQKKVLGEIQDELKQTAEIKTYPQNL